MKGSYTHSKTGNVYEARGLAKPMKTEPPFATQTLIAHCSENKEVEVVVYEEDGSFFFVPTDNPNLHENTKVKVLYKRDNTHWLRSEDDFEKPVDVNGKTVPRFQQIEEPKADQYKVITTAGELVFLGTLDELTDEFEIELERKLSTFIKLQLNNKEGFEIVLHSENELRETEIVKLLMMHTSGGYPKNLTDQILNVLGVGKVEKV